MVSNILLINFWMLLPATAQAQVTNVPQANNIPIVPYSGPEGSIARFLCVPNISNPTNSTNTNPQPQGNLPVIGSAGTTVPTSNPAAGDLSTCVNRLYRFAGAIGAFAAVFFIALAGYYYILGGEKAKERAKHMIISVIAGLVIIFTAYILLKQINPDAVKFKTIQPPTLGNVAALPTCEALGLPAGCNIDINDEENYVNGTTGGSLANAHPEASCSTHDCPSVKGSGVTCNDSGACKVQPNLLEKLKQLNELMKAANVPWHVSQGYPPSGTHGSACHNTTGSCIDASPDSKTAANFAKMCPLVKQVGLTLLNEAIVTKGTSAESVCGAFVKTKYAPETTSNSHLHIGLP